MRQELFAWITVDAIERGEFIELPGIGLLRPAQLIVPRQLWDSDVLNWETIQANAPKGTVVRGEFGEHPYDALVLTDRDEPTRRTVVDPARFDIVSFRRASQ